jgi:tetratricopeptide (TPR) repeat protein
MTFPNYLWNEFKKTMSEFSFKSKAIVGFICLFLIIFAFGTGSSVTIEYNKKELSEVTNWVKENTPHDNQRLAAAYYNTGNDYANKDRYGMAIKLYEIALKYEKEDPSIYNNIGSSYKHLGYKKQAEKYYEKAVEVDPEYTVRW